MPVFESFELDETLAQNAIQQYYGSTATLGQLLKSSQNRTYKGTIINPSTNEQSDVIYRVTPYSELKSKQITLEYEFLLYLSTHGSTCCAPIVPTIVVNDIESKQWIEFQDTTNNHKLFICVFQYANDGYKLDYMEYKWITEPQFTYLLGQFMGTFHTLSQEFVLRKLHLQSIDLRDESYNVNTYATNLSGTLSTVPINDIEEKQKLDYTQYGLLHGDVNFSNYFLHKDTNVPIMFDFDQIQLGWYLFDLSQPLWGVLVAIDANYGGQPLPDTITPTIFGEYGKSLINGYISTRKNVQFKSCDKTTNTIQFEYTEYPQFDIAQLQRMILLRRMQYYNFCSKAVGELEGDDSDASAMMKEFCQFMLNYVTKPGNEEQIQEYLKQLE